MTCVNYVNSPHIDQSGVYAIEEAILKLHNDGVVVVLTSIQPQPLDMLKKIDVIPDLLPEMHVFPSFGDCEVWLKHNLKNKEGGIEQIVQELKAVKKAKVAYRM